MSKDQNLSIQEIARSYEAIVPPFFPNASDDDVPPSSAAPACPPTLCEAVEVDDVDDVIDIEEIEDGVEEEAVDEYFPPEIWFARDRHRRERITRDIPRVDSNDWARALLEIRHRSLKQSFFHLRNERELKALATSLRDYHREKMQRLTIRSGDREYEGADSAGAATKRHQLHPVTRATVLLRDGARCTHKEDGKRCAKKTGLHIHHIIELYRGGSDAPINLTTLCREHHQERHMNFRLSEAPTMMTRMH